MPPPPAGVSSSAITTGRGGATTAGGDNDDDAETSLKLPGLAAATVGSGSGGGGGGGGGGSLSSHGRSVRLDDVDEAIEPGPFGWKFEKKKKKTQVIDLDAYASAAFRTRHYQ